MEINNSDKQRRSFLKSVFAAAIVLGLARVSEEISVNKGSKKIKMLTPDGKLVEIDESDYTQVAATQQRASNKEVQDWMNTSKT